MVEDVLTLGLGPTAESTESIVHYPRTHETECRCHQNRIYVMKASNFQNLEFRNYVFVLWARFRTHLRTLFESPLSYCFEVIWRCTFDPTKFVPDSLEPEPPVTLLLWHFCRGSLQPTPTLELLNYLKFLKKFCL
jgi:hypothetical protein